MLADKSSEPLAQGTRLIRNLVELTWHRARLQFIQHVRWHKLGLSQPLQSPSPLSSQSTGVSTGVATEFRKSRPSELAIKIAGGLCFTIGPG